MKPGTVRTQTSQELSSADNGSMGCIGIPLFIVVAYIVISAITRVTSHTGSRLDRAVCYGALILFATVLILGFRDMVRESQARQEETKEWMSACTVVQPKIIDRHEGGAFDDGNRFHSFPCRLELEMNVDQRAVSPNQTTVSVDVSQHIYDKLAGRDTVRICYRPEAPLVFLLEDEAGPLAR